MDDQDKEGRKLAGARRSGFHDEHEWPATFFDCDAAQQPASTQAIDDMAVVLSACAAIKRLMESVEQAACERPDLSSRLRASVTYREGDDEEPGAASGIPAVIDFLLAVADAVEASEELATRLRASLLKSVLGAQMRQDI